MGTRAPVPSHAGRVDRRKAGKAPSLPDDFRPNAATGGLDHPAGQGPHRPPTAAAPAPESGERPLSRFHPSTPSTEDTRRSRAASGRGRPHPHGEASSLTRARPVPPLPPPPHTHAQRVTQPGQALVRRMASGGQSQRRHQYPEALGGIPGRPGRMPACQTLRLDQEGRHDLGDDRGF